MMGAAVAASVFGGLLVRQSFVLAGVIRSRRFLRVKSYGDGSSAAGRQGPVFFITVPVLREAAVIAETVAHMEALGTGHRSQVVIVTTAREHAEAAARAEGVGTVEAVEKLAAAGAFVHVHYPDPLGLKGDQLNFAARYCASTLLGDVAPEDAFLLCYDADSRPALDSLERFEQAMSRFPEASVLHQSSRFELRARSYAREAGLLGRLARAVCDGGALRANRFVLGFEIPRLLNRSPTVGRRKRTACSYVYAHVTGHGLCVRLSAVLDLPFPCRSPLEDMHYSFYLGSRDLPIVAIPSLDSAEVPDTVAGQVEQAARWFFGPARALRYLRDPATRAGPRAATQAPSALGPAAEWLGCALLPPLTAAGAWLTDWPARGLPLAVIALYLAQLLPSEACLGAPADASRRLARLLACPLATVLFGLGGFIGAARLVSGGAGGGKTERR